MYRNGKWIAEYYFLRNDKYMSYSENEQRLHAINTALCQAGDFIIDGKLEGKNVYLEKQVC